MFQNVRTWARNKWASWKLAYSIGKMQGQMITELYLDSIQDSLEKKGIVKKRTEEEKHE